MTKRCRAIQVAVALACAMATIVSLYLTVGDAHDPEDGAPDTLNAAPSPAALPASAVIPPRLAPVVARPTPMRPPAPEPVTIPVPTPALGHDAPLAEPTSDVPAPREPEVLIDAWYGQYQGQHKIGWAHIVGTKTETGYEVVESYESRSGSVLTQLVTTNRTTFRAAMDLDFVVVSACVDFDESGQRASRVTVSRDGSTYSFTTHIEGRTTTRVCVVDAPVIGSNDLAMQHWHRNQRLFVGFTTTMRELDFGAARVNARELRCRANGQGEFVCDFDQITVALGPDGIVRLLESGTCRMVRGDRTAALDMPVQPPMFLCRSCISERPPTSRRWRSIRRAESGASRRGCSQTATASSSTRAAARCS